MKTIRHLFVLALCFLGISVLDGASRPLPDVIANNASALMLYHAGRVDALTDIAIRAANPELVGPSLRGMANANYLQANLFLPSAPHFAAYLWGRADALDDAADAGL